MKLIGETEAANRVCFRLDNGRADRSWLRLIIPASQPITDSVKIDGSLAFRDTLPSSPIDQTRREIGIQVWAFLQQRS